MRLVEALISALLVAGLYATMSYGLALIYGVMKIINLANAGVMMLGAFLTFFLWQSFGIDPLVSTLIVAPLAFGVGALIEAVFVRRVLNEKPVISLLLLFGILLVMQQGASFAFHGGDVRSVRPAYVQEVIHLGDITLAWTRLAVFVSGVVILVGLELFLRRTFLGSAIRDLAQDRDACRLAGIDVRRVSMIAFGLGSALAGAAGSLLTLVFAFDPVTPFSVLQLKSFTMIVLGGLESIPGDADAAFVLAGAEELHGPVTKAELQDT